MFRHCRDAWCKVNMDSNTLATSVRLQHASSSYHEQLARPFSTLGYRSSARETNVALFWSQESMEFLQKNRHGRVASKRILINSTSSSYSSRLMASVKPVLDSLCWSVAKGMLADTAGPRDNSCSMLNITREEGHSHFRYLQQRETCNSLKVMARGGGSSGQLAERDTIPCLPK